MYPEGWLLDPSGRLIVHFFSDSRSFKGWSIFYMDKWSASEAGTPYSLKNRRKVDLEPALETWNELIQNGWRQISDHLGEA